MSESRMFARNDSEIRCRYCGNYHDGVECPRGATIDLQAMRDRMADLENQLTQRDREVLALREGIQKHKDRYIFTNPDHEDYALWEILESTAQAGAEAERRVRQDEREKAAKAVDAVEELPGHMPDEMWAAIQNDRDAFEEALRITVRQSKCEAKAAILGTGHNP